MVARTFGFQRGNFPPKKCGRTRDLSKKPVSGVVDLEVDVMSIARPSQLLASSTLHSYALPDAQRSHFHHRAAVVAQASDGALPQQSEGHITQLSLVKAFGPALSAFTKKRCVFRGQNNKTPSYPSRICQVGNVCIVLLINLFLCSGFLNLRSDACMFPP